MGLRSRVGLIGRSGGGGGGVGGLVLLRFCIVLPSLCNERQSQWDLRKRRRSEAATYGEDRRIQCKVLYRSIDILLYQSPVKESHIFLALLTEVKKSSSPLT